MTWDAAVKAIKKSSEQSRIFIGCDSVRYKVGPNKWEARFDTVVIIHHPRDGCSIIPNSVKQPDYGNIKTRMLAEVGFVVEAATAIIDHLGPRSLEIHLDINTNPCYKSSVAVSEAIGWVRAQTGLTPKLKPEAWASTHTADACVRGKIK